MLRFKRFLLGAFAAGSLSLTFPMAAFADANCDAAEAIVFGDDFVNRASEALPLAEACRSGDPANGLWLKGLSLEKLNRYDEAIATYDALLVMEPNFAGGWSQRAGAKYSLKRFDAAIVDYNQAIKLESKADYYVGRGNVYDDSGQKDLAMADYTAAIAIEPNNAYIYRERSVAYNLRKNYAAALADAEKAIALDPNMPRGYVLRADNNWALEKRAEAFNDYLKYISYDQSKAYIYDRLGAYRYDVQDFPGSIQYYDRALLLEPSNAAYLVDRANARDDNKDVPGAMVDYNRALQIDANYARGYFDRGLSLERQGKKDLAISDYNKAIQLDPSDATAKSRLEYLKTH